MKMVPIFQFQGSGGSSDAIIELLRDQAEFKSSVIVLDYLDSSEQLNSCVQPHNSNDLSKSFRNEIMKHFKIVIEKHSDGYVAYPIGIVGSIVGQGDTYEGALNDVKSAIACYIEMFGKEILEDTPSVEVFIAETGVPV